MGKYLQMLDELYQPEEKNQISTEIEVTKPTKALLSPFVSANSKGIQFFSVSNPENASSNKQEDKTVKSSKQEPTKLTKGMHENADYHAKRIALEWLELIKETNPVHIEHVINVAITHPESLKFMERRINQLPSRSTKTTSEVNRHE